MIGGLSKINRYLLAGAGAIGILAAGVPAASAQDVQATSGPDRRHAGTIKALQQQVEDAKALPPRPKRPRLKPAKAIST